MWGGERWETSVEEIFAMENSYSNATNILNVIIYLLDSLFAVPRLFGVPRLFA